MSFSFSQSLLDGLPSSNPGAAASFSQKLDNSQGSCYSAPGGTQTSSSNYFPRISNAPPPFQMRRTLPRPPTWSNINIQQSQMKGGGKWRFGGRQEKEGRSALERDLQHHLQELSKQTNKVPGKLSIVVKESVKYMQQVSEKEGKDGREELYKLGNVANSLKRHIEDNESKNNEITEELTNLEAVLTECELLCKEVTKGKERNKQRLLKLQEQVQKFSHSKPKIDVKEVTKRFSRKDGLIRERRIKSNDMKQQVFSPSPIKRVLTNPLPTLRLLSIASPGGGSPHQGVCGAREETVDLERRTLRMRRFWDMEK